MLLGVALPAKKLQKQRIAGFLTHAEEHGWTVVHVDFAAGGTAAATLDVLLHKVTDTLADGGAAARAEAEAIWRFAADDPTLPWVDPLPEVLVLTDRVRTLERLRGCLDAHPGLFAVPPTVVVPAGTAAEHALALVQALTRPLLCKDRQACGVPSSHTMSVASADHDVATAIAGHGSDLVVQQLLPHNDMVLKVYVIADTVWVRSRMSLPADLSRPDVPLTEVNSQTVSKERDTDPRDALDAFAAHADHARLKQISLALGSSLGLSLFGFDVLYPTGSDMPTIVDVNYFPAYDGIPEFYPFLLDLLEKRRRRKPSP